MIYFVPALTLAVFVFGAIKKVNVYDSFTEGVKEAVGLTIKLIPYLATVFMLMELMRSSGLSAFSKTSTSNTGSIPTYPGRLRS